MTHPGLVKVEQGLQAIDLTRVIEYTKKIPDISKGFNTMLAPIYLRDFIMAIDVTNSLLARAIRSDLQAAAAVKNQESLAYIDRAGDYLKEKGIKDTAEARKRYVPLDGDVMKAYDLKAQTESMVSFLRNKMFEFRLAHDDVKKIAYSNDYQNNTSNEGM
jgi:hypothetical protein